MNTICQLFWSNLYSFDMKGENFILSHGSKPCIFIQLFLDPLCKLYESTVIDFDMEKILKITNTLNVDAKFTKGKESIYHKQGRSIFRTISSTWLPIAPAIFKSIVENIPSFKTSNIFNELSSLSIADQIPFQPNCVVIVAKLMPIIKGESMEQLIGISKVVEGSFVVGDLFYLSSDSKTFLMDHLFLIMGNDLIPIPSGTVLNVGCIFGICGIITCRIIKKAFFLIYLLFYRYDSHSHSLQNYLAPKLHDSSLTLSLVRVAVEPKIYLI